jgi:hypothetical protein
MNSTHCQLDVGGCCNVHKLIEWQGNLKRKKFAAAFLIQFAILSDMTLNSVLRISTIDE